MKIMIVYDNYVYKNEIIKDIIGKKDFADIVVNKQKTEDYLKSLLGKIFSEMIWKRINSVSDYHILENDLKNNYTEEIKILHLFANFFIVNEKEAMLSYKKIDYIEEPFRILHDKELSGIMFPDIKSYLPFCHNRAQEQSPVQSSIYVENAFDISGLINLSKISSFIQLLTGNFDTRYFNSLKEKDPFTLVKTSSDKVKIKKEYTYYQLLPDNMKSWFVMPYNYTENTDTASYTMERLHITDLAIKWVHGSISEEEFDKILDIYFYFFKIRNTRKCSKEKYLETAKNLYETKVSDRLNALEKNAHYAKLAALLKAGGIDLKDLQKKYLQYKEKIEKKSKNPSVEVIGHGDPGFANTLYNKDTQILKFIDPKGALTEEEMWTNPYYDIAKLSHCICGRYDFFNSGLFEIKLNVDFNYELTIPFNNEKYKELFKKKLEENGFDYNLVRIYEVSLFLSMLPLHMDNPYKVFGFILNAQNMLKEIEEYV